MKNEYDAIALAIDFLTKNEVVAIPTETVYGLAGNIFSEHAVKKIFEIKQRPFFNPLIVHIFDFKQLDELAIDIPEKARLLAKNFWPGSLTLVLKKNNSIPDILTANKNTVAIRMPNHPLTLKLLSKLDFPLAAPSANPFGSISPTSASHVETYFGDKISYILDGGNCKSGVESTIIGFENNEPILYRLCAIYIEEIEQKNSTIKIKNVNDAAPEAPGMLLKHYAPKTKLILVENVDEHILLHKEKKIALLLFKDKINSSSVFHQEILSSNGDLNEAASNLYAALHRLDKLNIEIIIAEKLPEIALGKTINDRLSRATKN